MEPISILIFVLQQALSTIVNIAKRKNELETTSPAVKVVIDIAKKTNFAANLLTISKIATEANTVMLSPLIDAGNSILEILLAIVEDTKGKRDFNLNILNHIQSLIEDRNETWICPKSKKAITLFIEEEEIGFACPYLLNRPPLGCKVTWKKVAFTALEFHPMIILPIWKAIFDFSALSFGISPMKTYGYCCFADFVFKNALGSV